MRSFALWLTALLIAGLALTGCGKQSAPPPQTTTENVTLFYGGEENGKMVTEQRQISLRPEDDKYTVVLTELIKGPDDPEYIANIDPATIVYGTIKQDKALIVDVSREFNRFGGSIAEVIGVSSVVNTLTQFKEIEKVKILVEGKELLGPSGMPRGFMGPFPTEP
ncbi:MAG TPA: GerMN domain-containing protein [Firmicutes bacterium]|nr:GerMN domain-containing protein [Bacillota bacterium]